MSTLLKWDITDKKGEDRMIHKLVHISMNLCLGSFRCRRVYIIM